MKLLFYILLLICTTQLRAQCHFSKDSCKNYVSNYRDQDLENYLLKSESCLKDGDEIHFYFYKAMSCRFAGDSENQLKNLLLGFDFLEKENELLKAKYYDQFAISFKQKNDGYLEQALNYIDKAIALKDSLGTNDISRSYIIRGNIFGKAHSRNSNLDSALVSFYKARDYDIDKSNYHLILGSINTIYLRRASNTDSVEINLKKIIDYELNRGNLESAAVSTNTLASCYRQQGKFDKAKTILDTLLSHVKESGWNDQVKFILENKFELSVALGDYTEALAWKDSLHILKYIDYQLNLDRVTKEHENEKLKLDIEKANATTYKNRLWLSILGGTTGTLCLFLFGMYKYFSLKRQKVEQALEAAKVRAAFDATIAKMDGELKERESIASVLHDQVASLLTAADLHLNVASKNDPSASGITKAVGLIRDINTNVRDLSHQLVSPALIKFGLESGIDSLVDRMETPNIYITYVSLLEGARYSSSLEAFIYQCASEFLHNVLKHSTATEATLYLSEENGKIILVVSDNGDNSHVSLNASTGLGLAHINARAAALGGHFSFTLNPNGAESLLEVPVVEAG